MEKDNPNPLLDNDDDDDMNYNILFQDNLSDDLLDIRDELYDELSTILDPEHPHTLGELNVLKEKYILLLYDNSNILHIKIYYKPTVPHCSLATLIALCIHHKLQTLFIHLNPFKLDLAIVPGTHETELEINKQINDKERVSAALEAPYLSDQIKKLCKQGYQNGFKNY